MTLTDYLMNIILIGLVVFQIRGHKVTKARLLFPLVVTVWVASQFLHAIAKAGLLAAILWVLGIGARMGFVLWVGHGGQPAVARFSIIHHITSGPAWGAAFILMAMAEVATRTCVLYVKTRRSGATIERGGLLRSAAAA